MCPSAKIRPYEPRSGLDGLWSGESSRQIGDPRALEVAQVHDVVEVAHRVEVTEADALAVDERLGHARNAIRRCRCVPLVTQRRRRSAVPSRGGGEPALPGPHFHPVRGQPQALRRSPGGRARSPSSRPNRRRYGKRFTVRLLQTPPFVMLSDPDEVREVFTAPPDVLHPGEGARILEPVIGPQLGDPPRRGRAPGAAQAHAARVPRREDAAPLRPHGRGGRARGRRAGRAIGRWSSTRCSRR